MSTAVFYHSMFIQMVKCFIQHKIDQHDYLTAYRTSIDALNFAPYDSGINTAMVITTSTIGKRLTSFLTSTRCRKVWTGFKSCGK